MNRNTATLRLTEPVIFLRSGADCTSRRRRALNVQNPPALLRAILTLKLVKPTRVKSIEVVFEGVAKTDWPDVGGATTRRMDVHEENTFLSAKIVLFQANQQKRSRTVGPGLYMGDRRSDVNGAIDYMTTTDDSIIGRKARRESANLDAFHAQPFAAFSGPEDAPDAGPSNVGTRLRLDLRPSDGQESPDLSSYALSPADTPPLYSSIVPLTQPGAVNHAEAKRTNRRSARLSLSGMLHDVREMVHGHPNRPGPENEGITLSPPLEREESNETGRRGRSLGRKDKGPIARLSEALGIDMNDDDKTIEDDPDWKELKPGNYNYPVSFMVPSDVPTSIEAELSSVRYKLRATVHRPGTFSTKITAATDVEVVSAPAEEDVEDGESIVVERQWDTELRYVVSIGSRNFPHGSDIPWTVQLLPLSKSKLHRLTFILEEKIEHSIHSCQLTGPDNVRRFLLLSIRHPQSLSSQKDVARNAPALLPIWSRESSQSSEAVLLPYADPPSTDSVVQTEEERKSVALAHLLDPTGPWHLRGTLKLPPSHLHTTHRKNSLSFVSVRHSLKIILRVERSESEWVDPKTGRKRLFDIIVETPVSILSKYCRRDWASLPSYENSDSPPMTDAEDGGGAHAIASRDSSSPRSPASPSIASAAVSSRPHTPHGGVSRGSGPCSPIEPIEDPFRQARVQTSQKFASLMAGFEDEGGELPPTYQSVTGNRGGPQGLPQSPLIARRREHTSGSRGPSTSRIIRSRSPSRTSD